MQFVNARGEFVAVNDRRKHNYSSSSSSSRNNNLNNLCQCQQCRGSSSSTGDSSDSNVSVSNSCESCDYPPRPHHLLRSASSPATSGDGCESIKQRLNLFKSRQKIDGAMSGCDVLSAQSSITISQHQQPADSIIPAVSASLSSRPRGFRPKIERCVECEQAVYPMEKVVAGQCVYHKWCFRCAKCNSVLSIANYAIAAAGIPYCKPHFTATFKQKGNFDDFAIERVSSSTPPTAAEVTTTTTTTTVVTTTADVDPTADRPTSTATTTTTVRTRKLITSTTPRPLKPVNGTIVDETEIQQQLQRVDVEEREEQQREGTLELPNNPSQASDKTIGFKDVRAKFETLQQLQ